MHRCRVRHDRGNALREIPQDALAVGLAERHGLERGERPFVFTNLKTGQGLDTVVRFIETEGLLGDVRPAA